MLWSIGCSSDVVFGGRNITSTSGWIVWRVTSWLPTLSRRSKTLNAKFFFVRNSLTSTTKEFLNQSSKMVFVTYALLLDFQKTGKWSLRLFFITRGFSDLYTNIGLHRYVPEALAQKSKVNLSLETLNPGADFSFLVKKVREGIFFQFGPVSSQLKIWSGT